MHPGDEPSPPPARRGAGRSRLATLYAGRLAGNWGLRFPYTFLPVLARGSGLSIDTLGLVLGLRELMGVTAPAMARPVDAGHQRLGMTAGLVAMAAGMAASVVLGLAGFLVGAVLFGAAKYLYDTAGNAWLGQAVPVTRRGRVVGLVETAWAAAFLAGVPLTAVLLDGIGWRAPFLGVAAACLVLVPVTLRTFPPDRTGRGAGAEDARDPLAPPRPAAPPTDAPATPAIPPAPTAPATPAGAAEPTNPAGSVAPVVAAARPGGPTFPSPRAFYLASALLAGGPQMVFASYGTWLEGSFGLSIAALGAVTALFGLTELVGSVSVAALTDRLGGPAAIVAGAGVLAPVLALTGPVGDSTADAVAVLAVAFLVFEFALVSALAVATEITPEQRAGGIGATYGAMTLGRALGTAGGIALFTASGIGATGASAAAAVVASAAVIIWSARRRSRTGPRRPAGDAAGAGDAPSPTG